MRLPVSAAILLLALAGCGSKPTPAATAPDAASTTLVAAAGDDEPQSGAPAGITAIDAAAGDAQAMPADSFAPSSYDVARRAARAKDAAEQHEARAVPAVPEDPARLGQPTDLLGSDEAVTAGG